jgi:arylsulfatase A-like enzyme
MGEVLEGLKAGGVEDNTLVICTTDHGLAFPNMKCTLSDGGTGVMLMMRLPGLTAPGTVTDALVSQIDLLPTICDLARIDPPGWLQGQSLLPLIRGEHPSVREQLFAEVNYHCAYDPMRAIRTERWKYIRRYADYGCPMLSNIDDSPSKGLLMRYGFAERVLAAEELYDLVYDPIETCNRANDPASAGVLSDMRGRLDRWMQSTADPLVYGPIPLPDGAVVGEPTDVSPDDIWTRIEKRPGLA